MHPEIQEILKTFEEINKIPRCSKHEAKISNWLKNWGEAQGLEVKTDAVKNVLIRVSASPGYENSQTLVLQGHMDMVCEKCSNSEHDFSKAPIPCLLEGDWLRAKDTSLGADNGIALALGLGLAKSKRAKHPPLELLFTVDEENGLTGANALEPDFLEGKILLNLDSEDEGIFTVGCAGGENTRIRFLPEYETLDYGTKLGLFSLKIGGLKGGHSGTEIKAQRANALQILARGLALLLKITKKKGGGNVNPLFLKGGSSHNSIPCFAEGLLALEKESFSECKKSISEFEKTLQREYAQTDPGLELKFEEEGEEALKKVQGLKDCKGRELKQKAPVKVMTRASAEKLVWLLLSLPHGVYRMADDVEGLVETSNNLALLRMTEGKIEILSSQRSSFKSRRAEITEKIEAVAKLAGAKVWQENSYPAWEPKMNSELLTRCISTYEKCFGKKATIEVIHAGLECGVIGSKYPDMEMISFGPTIKAPHSPEEKLHIPSLEKTWIFLLALLESYC